MNEELRGAKREIVNIVQLLLPHHANVVAKVQKSLRGAVTRKRGQHGWPNSDVDKEHYRPFSELLNDTFRTARYALGSNSGAYYAFLHTTAPPETTLKLTPHSNLASLVALTIFEPIELYFGVRFASPLT